MKNFILFLFCSVLVWPAFSQVASEKEVVTRGHEAISVAYSPDGKLIATAGIDRTVRVFRVNTWEEIARLKGLKNMPYSVTFSNDGKYIAAGGKDKRVTIWNVTTQLIAQTFVGHKGYVGDIDFSPDDKFIVTAGYDKTVKYWNAMSGMLVKTFVGHTKEVTTVEFSPNGEQIASGSADETVVIWDINSGTGIKSIKACDSWVRCVAYSPDGSLIASVGDDRRIQIWDAVSGKKLNTFLGHKKWVYSVSFSPDGNYLLSGGHDNVVMLTDLRTGKMVFSGKQKNYILDVAFNPNGETFATTELYSQKVMVWNARGLNIKPLDLGVAQKMSKSSGMAPKISWVSPQNGNNISVASTKINARIQSQSSLRKIELYLNGKLFASRDRSELMLETAENEITNYVETVVLNEGANTLLIKAKNIAGEGISEQITINYNQAATQLISWLNPASDNMESKNPSFPLIALLNPASSAQTVFVMVNNITQHTLNLPATGGMINQTVNLQRGLNTVKFVIQTSEYTKEAQVRTIQLNQANKPIVSWWLPLKDTMSYVSTARISGAISSQIPLTRVEILVNGIASFTKSNLEATQFVVDQQILLKAGMNSVQIVGTNEAGKTISTNRMITYEIPAQANISWITPSGKSSVFAGLLEVNACIQTIQAISKVQIFNNGIPVMTDVQVKSVPGAECNVNYKRPVMLNVGANVLKITAETASGVISTDEIVVNYIVPEKALVSWVNPIENSIVSAEQTISIQACIKSNTPLSEVTVLSNNHVISTIPNPQKTTENCSFDLNQVVPLAKGINNIVVKAVNMAGETMATPLVVDHKTVNPYRFALIIGNEDYSSYQAELESESDVDFALNDARSFKKTCVNTLGILEDNIIYHENARYIDMRRAMKKMNGIMQVTAGKAEVFVYYAGHGFPDEKTKEPYLVPVDGSGSDLEFSAVKLSDFYAQLTEFPAERVSVFIDACFSGGARNQGLVAARGVKVIPKETKAAVKKKLIVFTASSGNQTSLPYKAKNHGMFTYFLVKKMEEKGSSLTYKELSDYVQEQVGLKSIMVNNKDQNPQTNISPEVEAEWKAWTFE